MRPILAFIAVFLLVTGTAAAGDWNLGLQAGINSSGLSGDTPSGFSFGKKSGLAAGAVAELKIAEDVWLSFQPMYLQRGSSSKISVPDSPEKLEGPTVSLDYVAIPILARIVANSGKTYVTGGLNPAFLLDSSLEEDGVTEDISDAVNGFDLAADIGFGVMLPVGGPTLTFEIRYEQSILNLAAKNRVEGEDTLPVRFRSSGFQFFTGLQWALGGR